MLSAAGNVRIESQGMISLGEDCAIADLVERLVRGGIRVSAVEPVRRNLEEIYLSLTHPDAMAKIS